MREARAGGVAGGRGGEGKRRGGVGWQGGGEATEEILEDQCSKEEVPRHYRGTYLNGELRVGVRLL